MIQEHDCIVLTANLPEEGLEAGDVGTVVHIHPDAAAYEVEFMTLTMWDSMDAVHAFSGNGRAVIHETARPLLTHFDEYSIHYDGTFVP